MFVVVLICQKYMLSAADSDGGRVCVINKILKTLTDLKSLPFFSDLVAIIQPTIVANINKCTAVDSKQQLRSAIESFLNVLPDTEPKTLFTQILNKL